MDEPIFNFKEIDLTVQKVFSEITLNMEENFIPKNNLDIEYLLDYHMQKLYLRLKALVLTGPEKDFRQVVKTTIRIPTNWFEHLKKDLNFAWLLKLSPVKYVEQDHYQEVYLKVTPTFPEYKGALNSLGPVHLKILVSDQNLGYKDSLVD
jgi:hypothetical protein